MTAHASQSKPMPMLRLGLTAAALVTLMGGCIIDSSDDDLGQFRATWSLVSSGGQAITCGQAGVVRVSFLATERSTGFGHDDIFFCADMAGITAPLPGDQYTVAASALDQNDANLSASVPFEIGLCSGCLVDLPAVVFALTPG